MTTDPVRVLTTAPVDASSGHEGIEACSVDNPASRVIRETLARVGDKWSMLVIGVLHDGPCGSPSCSARSTASRTAC